MFGQRKAIIDCLKSLGVANVDVSASGGGDEGHIESVSFRDKNGEEMTVDDNLEIAYIVIRRSSYYSKDKTTVYEERKTSLKMAIENLAYDDVSRTGIDWYNNEGGSFEWSINIADEAYKVEVCQNEDKDVECENWQLNLNDWLGEEEKKIEARAAPVAVEATVGEVVEVVV